MADIPLYTGPVENNKSARLEPKENGKFEYKMYGSIPTKKLTKLKLYKITAADFICYSHEDLPYRAIRKHKPAGVIAHTVNTQNQYLKVAPHCDNIIFSGFKPYI